MWFVRAVLSALAGFTVLILTMPAGCGDVGGVPSWERCSSFIGLPAIALGDDLGIGSTWNWLGPMLLAAVIAALVWAILGPVLGRDE